MDRTSSTFPSSLSSQCSSPRYSTHSTSSRCSVALCGLQIYTITTRGKKKTSFVSILLASSILKLNGLKCHRADVCWIDRVDDHLHSFKPHSVKGSQSCSFWSIYKLTIPSFEGNRSCIVRRQPSQQRNWWYVRLQY